MNNLYLNLADVTVNSNMRIMSCFAEFYFQLTCRLILENVHPMALCVK